MIPGSCSSGWSEATISQTNKQLASIGEQPMCQVALATDAYPPPTFGEGHEPRRVARWRLRVGPYEVLLYSSGRGRGRRLAPYLSSSLQRIFIHRSNILC